MPQVQLLPSRLSNSASLDIGIVVNQSEMDAMVERLDDIGPLLERIARIMRRAAAARFRQGGPGWQELAASTVAAKRALEQPMPGKDGRAEMRRYRQQGASAAAETILVRSGRLRDSWVRKRDPDHVESLDQDSGTVSIGSKLPYAEAHQKGTQPYQILPVQALALKFVGSNGRPVFAKSVSHPGLPRRAVELRPRDFEMIREEVARWLSGPLPDAED